MQIAPSVLTPVAAASLLAWWRDAGVDALVGETPCDWLAIPSARTAATRTAAPFAQTPQPLPATLNDLIAWFVTAQDVPGGGPLSQRIAPAGDPQAELMVLIDMPEPEDAAAGRLLSGATGDLFDKMLGAMKLDRASIWFAPMIPSRTLGAPLTPVEAERVAEIARHHIALIAPKKLWLLGRAASRAVLGMDEGEARGRLHLINQNSSKTLAIASVHPKVLLQIPKRKAEVWADMQKLFEE